MRNSASVRSYVWVPITDADDSPSEVVLGTATVSAPGGIPRTVQLKFKNTEGRRAVSWDRFEVAQGDGFATVASHTVSADGQTVAVTLNVMNFDVPVDLQVTGYGKAQQRVESSDLVIEITDFDTVGTFGRKPLELPVWFRPNYAGLATYTRAWLRYLSQPPEHIVTTYSALQSTKGRSDVLNSVIPGTVASHSHVIDDREVSLEGFCLAKRIDWGLNIRPLQTFYSVQRRAEPPAPLIVRFDDITSFSTDAFVRVPTPVGEEIYASYRGASPHPLVWGLS